MPLAKWTFLYLWDYNITVAKFFFQKIKTRFKLF